MADMKDKVDMREVESEVAKALRPLSDQPRRDDQIPNDLRPRVGVAKPGAFPQPVDTQAPAQAADKPWEPQRTVVTHLEDIEKLGNATLDRINGQDKNLAQILGSINDRLGLVLDRIGVLENMIGGRS